MNLKKRVASLLAAGALTGASLVGLSASSASAVDHCSISTIIRNNSDGVGHFPVDRTLYTHPYSACGKVGTFVAGTRFAYWCYVQNDYGHNWIFGRIIGTDTKGWIDARNITWDSGSMNYC